MVTSVNSNKAIAATPAAAPRSEAAASSQADGYSGQVATLDAGAIYKKNPALCSPSSDKEMSFMEVAGAAFVGVAAFACCCGGKAKS